MLDFPHGLLTLQPIERNSNHNNIATTLYIQHYFHCEEYNLHIEKTNKQTFHYGYVAIDDVQREY